MAAVGVVVLLHRLAQEEVAVLGVVEMGQTHPQTRKTVL
jgi:hypothetical protein